MNVRGSEGKEEEYEGEKEEIITQKRGREKGRK